MITGIRSAILCREVRQDPQGGVDYLGIHGDAILSASRPGLVNFWLALIVELDERTASGHVSVLAADFSFEAPFEAPPGLIISAMAFPVAIPVLRPSTLMVSLKEANRRPFQMRWKIDFEPNAPVLEPEAADDFIAASKEAMQVVTTGLAPRRGAGH